MRVRRGSAALVDRDALGRVTECVQDCRLLSDQQGQSKEERGENRAPASRTAPTSWGPRAGATMICHQKRELTPARNERLAVSCTPFTD